MGKKRNKNEIKEKIVGIDNLDEIINNNTDDNIEDNKPIFIQQELSRRDVIDITINAMNKEKENLEKDIVRITVDELKKRGLISNSKSSYQLTEQALYLYPKIKEAIKIKEEEIKDLKEYGIPQTSKSITAINKSGIFLDKHDILDSNINNLVQSNIINRHYLDRMNRILDTIREDEYYPIIEMKYFESKSQQDIAFELGVDDSTVARNKKRLINKIKDLIVSNNSIQEIGY